MDAPTSHEVTRLLGELNRGNRDAIDILMPLVYDELRRIAGRHLSHERQDHTLQPTALVHEAFLRMVDQDNCQWQSRLHFLSVAATMMRRVLIDHAKARFRHKRGGPGQQKINIDDMNIAVEERAVEVIAIDEALRKLAMLDPLQARVVELRFFGGVSVEETAQILELSEATIKRYTNSARAFLHMAIYRGGKAGA
ncbi:MAG: sigma-70 family RNA polymerase sigma factor [Bryobacterales bacterium]|nr:sigma-70 family RNA polymerase sigma factor [Bryobacterales bacterium]